MSVSPEEPSSIHTNQFALGLYLCPFLRPQSRRRNGASPSPLVTGSGLLTVCIIALVLFVLCSFQREIDDWSFLVLVPNLNTPTRLLFRLGKLLNNTFVGDGYSLCWDRSSIRFSDRSRDQEHFASSSNVLLASNLQLDFCTPINRVQKTPSWILSLSCRVHFSLITRFCWSARPSRLLQSTRKNASTAASSSSSHRLGTNTLTSTLDVPCVLMAHCNFNSLHCIKQAGVNINLFLV